MTEVLYQPSAYGAQYSALDTHEALGGGAAGTGKSEILMMEPLEQVHVEHTRCMFGDPRQKKRAREYARQSGLPEDLIDLCEQHPLRWGQSVGWALLLRREFPRLRDIIPRALKVYQTLDPDARWDQESHTLHMSSGYRFQFGHCRDPHDWRNYQGLQFTIILWDELTEFEREQYAQVNTRLRTSDPVLILMLKIRAMSNPGLSPTGDDWVRSYFVEPAPEGGVILEDSLTLRDGTQVVRTRIFLPARLEDNPNVEFRQRYEADLRSAPEHIQAMFLRGDWWFVQGAFFGSDWDPNLHVCKPFRIPNDWPRFRSMDWGFKTEGCVHWWALDPDGNLYCTRELTFKLLDAGEVAKRIREIEQADKLWAGKRSGITGPADTQLWEERGDRGKSKAEEMAAVGVTWVRADKKSRATNAERMLVRLRDHHDRTTTPGLVYFNNCRMAIRTIPAMPTDPNDSSVPVKGGADHWLDSSMYACAFASHGAKAIPKRRTEDDDEADEYEAEKKRRGRGGRFGYGSDVLRAIVRLPATWKIMKFHYQKG